MAASSGFADDDLEAVLRCARALHLLPHMRQQDVDCECLAVATNEELTSLGATTMGLRHRIRKAVKVQEGDADSCLSATGGREGRRHSVSVAADQLSPRRPHSQRWQHSFADTLRHSIAETHVSRRSGGSSKHPHNGSFGNTPNRHVHAAAGSGNNRTSNNNNNTLRMSMRSMRSMRSDGAISVGDRIERNNHAGFGFMPWALPDPDDDSVVPEDVERMYEPASQTYKFESPSTLGNVFYIALFGWWLALVYAVVGALQCATIVNRSYGVWCLRAARYILCPFGSHVRHDRGGLLPAARGSAGGKAGPSERTPLATSPLPSVETASDGPAGASSALFRFVFAPLLAAAHGLAFAVSWFVVVGVPTARLQKDVAQLLYSRDVLGSSFVFERPASDDASVLICHVRAFGLSYFKYQVLGVNICMLNLLLFVPLNFAVKFGASEAWVEENSIAVMICGMAAIVPLSYYIGHSVAAVASQTSFFVGAVLNATFGSIIELIIYFISLNKGLNELVVSATTGALLACMLLLPGLSMIAGGARYKEQRFNRKAGNVSAVMLFVAVAGLFMPSIYYNIFRRYRTACDHCEVYTQDTPVGKSVGNLSEDGYFRCASCNYTDHDYETDPVYTEKMEPMMYAVAVLLLLCYLVGLIFTLHTHSFIYDEESSDGEGDEELEYDRTLYGTHAPVYPTKPHGSASESPPAEGNPLVANPWEIEAAAAGGGAAAAEGSKADAAAHHGHGPQWSTRVCIAVMVSGTVCFAVCSEALVDALTPSLDKMGITENFAGLTMIALIPCIAEFSNAIQFALQDNIKLSLEIGNIAAIQMVFVQIPLLTFGSVMLGKRYPTDGFVLLYPKLNLCAVFIAVLVLTYVLVDGSSNYFQGVILLTIYVITLLVFYYVPEDLAEEL